MKKFFVLKSAIAQLTSGLRVLKTPQQPLADGNQSQAVCFINKKLTPADAVSRLEPIIKSFLAVEIIKKTLNATSSQVDVEVSMNLVDQPNQTLFKTSTVRGKNNRGESKQRYSQKLPLAKLFQFKVTNHESTPVYLTSLLVDSTGGLVSEQLSVISYQLRIKN